MDKNILVIGNGFDLYHGFATKYINFVDRTRCYIESAESKASSQEERDWINAVRNNMFIKYFQKVADQNHTWIDCEQEIKRLVSVILKAINAADVDRDNNVVVNGLSRTELAILANASSIFAVDIVDSDVVPDLGYVHQYYVLNKDLIIKDIRKELDDLIEALNGYLVLATNGSITKKSPQIESIKWDYVVNFNYTDTYKYYGIKDEDVFFIHGRLGSDPNNMVLGFDDDDECDLDSIYFKKYFQRIQKLTGNLDRNKFEPNIDDIFDNNASVGVISHFFGLSMSKTDGDMIKEISELSTKIKVYYCSQEDYAQKIVNLIDVFGKKEAMERIQDGRIELVQID